jgi:hypothetical protein
MAVIVQWDGETDMSDRLQCCPICGNILTLDSQLFDESCIDPSHWQAAGLLSPRDYYPMAQIAARANQRPVSAAPSAKLSQEIS